MSALEQSVTATMSPCISPLSSDTLRLAEAWGMKGDSTTIGLEPSR